MQDSDSVVLSIQEINQAGLGRVELPGETSEIDWNRE